MKPPMRPPVVPPIRMSQLIEKIKEWRNKSKESNNTPGWSTHVFVEGKQR